MSRKIRTVELSTPFETDSALSWSDAYPRPQMKRDSYLSLCGGWEYSVHCGGAEESFGEIKVPFVAESRLSGINRPLKKDERYIYRKSFAFPEDFNRGRILLHFGAVDQICKVRLNGELVGEHKGGYTPFSFDIPMILPYLLCQMLSKLSAPAFLLPPAQPFPD